jgi:uncharacterized protein
MSKRDQEDEFFHSQDAEKLEKLKAEADAAAAKAAREEARKLHHFKCGKCGGEMTTHMFRGVPIERCNDCDAVLLDPGELEQLAGEDHTEVFASFFNLFGGRK